MRREKGENILQHIEKVGRIKQVVLDLSGNELTSLPPDIGQLANLSMLDLSGNPLDPPPPEILAWEIERIRLYFEFWGSEKQPLNEVKVLLVGDGGAGKTSLVKQLLGEEFDKNEPHEKISLINL